jgi:hypothetical protein
VLHARSLATGARTPIVIRASVVADAGPKGESHGGELSLRASLDSAALADLISMLRRERDDRRSGGGGADDQGRAGGP